MVDSREPAVRWAAAISNNLLVNMSPRQVEDLLTKYVETLLTDELAAARQVGRSMVEHDIISSDTLERSIRFLGEQTPLRPALLGALAAGFTEALRDRTLDQQEMSRTAAMDAMRRAELALRESEAKFRAIFRSSPVAIVVSGLDGEIVEFNEALLSLLDYSANDLRAMSGRELLHPDDRRSTRELAERLIHSDGEHFRTESRMLRSDGETIAVLVAVSLVRDEKGTPAYFVTMIENLDEVRALQTQLVRQSLNDVQTGLPNRPQFLGWLESAVGTQGPETLALVQIDIDGFRVVNDAFGHDAGNRVLTTVANHLRSVFGAAGQLARIGEDEFGVLIKDPVDVPSVIALVDAFTSRLEEPVWVDDGHGVGVTASVGIVARAARGGDAADLLRAADVTVGWAKRDGKAQWALYDPMRDRRDRERFALAASIPGALEEGQFRVDYLPVYSLRDRRVLAVEAKLTWDHPEYGLLCPEEFLGLSADTGLIVRLIHWALEHACAQAGEWFTELGESTPVLSIDLPPRLCQEPELGAEVVRVLEQTRLPATLLRFELHEHLPALLNEDQIEELTILAERGIQLVLDQMGGGNVGVDKIRQLPLTGVKFSGTAVHGLADGANHVDESASVALLEWSKVLRVPRYAEDIRTETEARRLAELGVSGGQGPFFGPALTAAEVHDLLVGS
ncbi:EAL domain-containing protein [Lentzea sp. NBRC 105346]|uniref:putative bifunctional diguanylate cyclase/phosphodiesterase n=1 Tax=Lentzea sp. NBRC 105346 TaxID=3032205 RepID=UPI00255483A1|nr:EAL domain-containing protein [Lentzea sp. NBRC 105346]